MTGTATVPAQKLYNLSISVLGALQIIMLHVVRLLRPTTACFAPRIFSVFMPKAAHAVVTIVS